jgi:hypothetical protein
MKVAREQHANVQSLAPLAPTAWEVLLGMTYQESKQLNFLRIDASGAHNPAIGLHRDIGRVTARQRKGYSLSKYTRLRLFYSPSTRHELGNQKPHTNS